jgi:hypothetical protein
MPGSFPRNFLPGPPCWSKPAWGGIRPCPGPEARGWRSPQAGRLSQGGPGPPPGPGSGGRPGPGPLPFPPGPRASSGGAPPPRGLWPPPSSAAPPPRARTARPTFRASTSWTTPSSWERRGSSSPRGSRERSSTTLGSPPWASRKARNFSKALPSSKALRARPGSNPSSFRASSARVRATCKRSLGPSPFRVRMASRTSRAFPTACPKGASMLVRTARTRREAPFPMATMASARARAASRVFMKAPLAHLHVQNDAPGPGGQLFAHDGAGDEGKAFHRGRHVPEGVELPVQGGQFLALGGDDQAHLPRPFQELRLRHLPPASPGWTPACQWSPRCGPGPGPTSWPPCTRWRPGWGPPPGWSCPPPLRRSACPRGGGGGRGPGPSPNGP